MAKPGGAVRPPGEIREAMAGTRAANADGSPTRATCRQVLALFTTVRDPRQAWKVRYPLGEVLLVAFVAVMCDANTWVDMENLGNAKLRWLRRFAPFREGVPSHDTFRYVFGILDTDEPRSLIVTFVVENLCAVRPGLGVEAPRAQWALDGKAERGTGRDHEHSEGGEPGDVQTFHVFDCSSNVGVWSEAIDEKTNEIPVAQAWLANEANDIKGAIITADALHTQKRTVEIIVSREADYVLAPRATRARRARRAPTTSTTRGSSRGPGASRSATTGSPTGPTGRSRSGRPSAAARSRGSSPAGRGSGRSCARSRP